jgi:hypothetical protein
MRLPPTHSVLSSVPPGGEQKRFDAIRTRLYSSQIIHCTWFTGKLFIAVSYGKGSVEIEKAPAIDRGFSFTISILLNGWTLLRHAQRE